MKTLFALIALLVATATFAQGNKTDQSWDRARFISNVYYTAAKIQAAKIADVEADTSKMFMIEKGSMSYFGKKEKWGTKKEYLEKLHKEMVSLKKARDEEVAELTKAEF